MTEKTHFWGEVLGVAGLSWCLPIAVVSGAITAAKGEGFEKGANAIADPFCNALERFGNAHGERITNAAFSIAATVIAGEIKKDMA